MVSANPVYGLNALGGAAVLTMKNGFTYQGFENEIAGGSFGQRSDQFQYGKQVGSFAAYLAGRWFDEDGWRAVLARSFAPDLRRHRRARRQGLARHQLKPARTTASPARATTPDAVAGDRPLADFTTPQDNTNQLEFVAVNGAYQATDSLSFQANVYRREFHQTVVNGNTTDYTACASDNGLLCQPGGMTPAHQHRRRRDPRSVERRRRPDRRERHRDDPRGHDRWHAAGDLYRRRARPRKPFVLGGSVDHSDVDFQSAAQIGVINTALQVLPSGFFVDTPENTGFIATPVSLSATNNYYGAFVTDTFNLTPALAITASGRYNLAEISLVDHLGPNLTGFNRYSRLNPAIGASYKLGAGVTAYAGYSEGNRAPTPSEIECSNPAQPCLLPSSLSSDPPNLKQVVSHTYEAGLRGNFRLPDTVPGRFTWNFGLFRTDLDDDIYGVATTISTGFFENIGATRRQGIETGIAYKDENWTAFATYSLVDATFQSTLTLPSASNPFASAAGAIQVMPGDRLPGLPLHQLKAGVDYRVTPKWTVGAVLTYFSDQYLRGDESNQNAPLPGYTVINLHSSYEVNEHIEVFANISNLLDAKYATFGQYGDPTGVGAPGVPTNGIGVDNRFLGPAAPISVYGGMRIKF